MRRGGEGHGGVWRARRARRGEAGHVMVKPGKLSSYFCMPCSPACAHQPLSFSRWRAPMRSMLEGVIVRCLCQGWPRIGLPCLCKSSGLCAMQSKARHCSAGADGSLYRKHQPNLHHGRHHAHSPKFPHSQIHDFGRFHTGRGGSDQEVWGQLGAIWSQPTWATLWPSWGYLEACCGH